MSQGTKIEWSEATWNPVTGCTRVSAGCDNCYAVKQTYRLEQMGQAAKYGGLTVLNGKGDRHFNGVVKCHDDALQIPLKRRKPTTYFVNSMSDLFHEDVPGTFIAKVFSVMAKAPQHTYQILTKRPERMAQSLPQSYLTCSVCMGSGCNYCNDHGVRMWADGPYHNVWLGTSVENQAAADSRIPHLLKCPAAVRFLSVEPLLGPVDLRKFLGVSDESKTQRRGNISTRTIGTVEHRRRGSSLEGREACGTQGDLSTGARHAQSTADSCIGPSSCVETFLRPDTEGKDDQSSERDKNGQSSEQFGIGDTVRADCSCASDFREGSASRTPEQSRQTQLRGGEGNSGTTKSRRETESDSVGLRDKRPNGVQDRSRPQVGIGWIICGGESGPGARICNVEWVRSILNQCQAAGVPCFVKQLGENIRADEPEGIVKIRLSKKGGDMSEWPMDLRVRELPEGRG